MKELDSNTVEIKLTKCFNNKHKLYFFSKLLKFWNGFSEYKLVLFLYEFMFDPNVSLNLKINEIKCIVHLFKISILN